MSRSYKKTPVSGITTAVSEKQDKQLANRLERRKNKVILKMTQDETALRLKREVSDVWGMGKDGKMRFDPTKHPALLLRYPTLNISSAKIAQDQHHPQE